MYRLHRRTRNTGHKIRSRRMPTRRLTHALRYKIIAI